MQNQITKGWADYELLDSGEGERLERFGQYLIVKPDPSAVWDKSLPATDWQKANAVFDKFARSWQTGQNFPEKWQVNYKELKFWLKLTPFKHTGLFPEQHTQWDFVAETIKGKPNIKILNLFGYTGALSLAAASAGATVTHIDASRPALTWARENQSLSRLDKATIRYIPEDSILFTQREIKRGNKYDGIIMDPPVYGHGPKGEIWDFNKHFPILLDNCLQILSDKPLFVLVNAYAVSTSSISLGNILMSKTKALGGKVISGEVGLEEATGGRVLSTGIYALWTR
jgi:23S rRNA (cytosine1962-C5)-methyltransferase